MPSSSIYERAKAAFSVYQLNDAGDPLPAGHFASLQVRLYRWALSVVGLSKDEHLVLGLVEELAEEFPLSQTTEQVADALADALIYLTQLCTNHRMDFLALRMTPAAQLEVDNWEQPPFVEAMKTVGRLARLVGKEGQGFRRAPGDYREKLALEGARLCAWLDMVAEEVGVDLVPAYFKTAEAVMLRTRETVAEKAQAEAGGE